MKINKRGNAAILGVIIFILIIVIAVILAWSLGYIQFGKQPNIDNNSNDISSENVNKPSNESQTQEPVKDNKDILKEAYKKYDFEWISKRKNTITYVETATIRIATGDKGIKDIEFDHGTPKYTCPLPGQELTGITVVTENGEVYIGKIDNYSTYSISSFIKVEMPEKIVDVCFNGDEAVRPYSGPYYMTEKGRVLDRNGNTYEEINRDHVDFVGTILGLVYICEDNTIDIPQDGESLTTYVKAMDINKNNIKAKYVFYDENDDIFYIVSENNRLYKIDNMATGMTSLVNDREVTSVSYTEKEKHFLVNYSQGSKDIFDEVYEPYDLENSRHMQ